MEGVLLILCYVADLIFGDPEWFFHPVRAMGKLINFLDSKLRGNSNKNIERLKGAILSFIVVGTSTFLAYLFLRLANTINSFLGNLVWVYLGYTTLSVKDLQVKAKDILNELNKNSLVKARKNLSKIVGRDTENLNSRRIVIATIESIAENINDGIIAPLIYLILGGPVLGITYKSVNTLDSMVGYKNKKYIHFGWFSAKLDDVFNYIPARISGFLICLSSFIIGRGFLYPFKIMIRDGRKHPSPNSGISEAAMAGALGIKLGGKWLYGGKVSIRPYIGDDKRKIKISFINEALRISFITSFLIVFIGVILKWVI